jgi:hypothetical protein
MQSTLQEHILRLELKIQTLCDQLTDPYRTNAERERFQAEIRVAELALAHYRKAYELEQSSTNPPDDEMGPDESAERRGHGRRPRGGHRTKLRTKIARRVPSRASHTAVLNQIR